MRTDEPLFHEGFGVSLKNSGSTPWGAPCAVSDANRDPAAFGILVSSALLSLFPSRRECA